MITHYDMASGEIIHDDPQNEHHASFANAEFAQLRLQTVTEAVTEEQRAQRTTEIPADLCNANLENFITTQK